MDCTFALAYLTRLFYKPVSHQHSSSINFLTFFYLSEQFSSKKKYLIGFIINRQPCGCVRNWILFHVVAIFIPNLSALALFWFIQFFPYHNDSLGFSANKMLTQIHSSDHHSDTAAVRYTHTFSTSLKNLVHSTSSLWRKEKKAMSLWKSLVMVTITSCSALFCVFHQPDNVSSGKL